MSDYLREFRPFSYLSFDLLQTHIFTFYFLTIYNCFRFFFIVTHISFMIAVTRKRSKCNEHDCEVLPIRREAVELNTLKDREDKTLKTEDESLKRSLLSNSNE